MKRTAMQFQPLVFTVINYRIDCKSIECYEFLSSLKVLRPDGPFLFAAEKEAKAAKGFPPLESPLPRAAGEGARKRRALQIASSRGAKLEAEPR